MSSKARRSSVLPPAPKDQTRLRIEKMEAERQQRRRAMQQQKQSRDEEEQRNIAAGNPGDVDFIGMVRDWRNQHCDKARPLGGGDANYQHPRICICVRKRPISDKERNKNDHDSVTCFNPVVCIHSAKFKVDGITKYLDHQSFRFDHAFDENVTTEDVYTNTTLPLLDFVCRGTGGRATVFAYGQTGSGKTHTMNGIQQLLCEDLFLLLSETPESPASHERTDAWCSLSDTSVNISFFEMYGGAVQDLLNNRNRLKLLEDGKGEIQVTGLKELEASTPSEFFELVNSGNQERTTRATQANDTSSRSHAICQIVLRHRSSGKLRGKLSLVDLAGSERGADTTSHNAQRRAESADINTSLLSLKECIRALDMNKNNKGGAGNHKHVPYRGSKLTLILKDCFTSPAAMTTMIATVSPGASAADHSLNTLRYADRIKEQRVGGQSAGSARLSPIRRKKLSPKNSSLSAASASVKGTNGRSNSHSPKRHHGTKGLSRGSTDLSATSKGSDSGPAADDEEELRQTVQALFEQEESILNLHMSHIQENAEILTTEGRLLEEVQQAGVSDADMDRYVLSLEAILDQKEVMILELQDKLEAFQKQMQREQELSKKVGTLKQY